MLIQIKHRASGALLFRQAEAFLLAIWPCLLTKKYRRRIALGLHFQAQKEPANVIRWSSPEERAIYFARQLSYYDEMKRLNVRGRGGTEVW